MNRFQLPVTRYWGLGTRGVLVASIDIHHIQSILCRSSNSNRCCRGQPIQAYLAQHWLRICSFNLLFSPLMFSNLILPDLNLLPFSFLPWFHLNSDPQLSLLLWPLLLPISGLQDLLFQCHNKQAHLSEGELICLQRSYDHKRRGDTMQLLFFNWRNRNYLEEPSIHPFSQEVRSGFQPFQWLYFRHSWSSAEHPRTL